MSGRRARARAAANAARRQDEATALLPEHEPLFGERQRALRAGRIDEARAAEDRLIALNPKRYGWMRLRPAL